ncbi:class I adenylate-forming enzyme family protein [Spongiactinospora sp. TRM90649]|uniref:class I adenylate-forming enzyme family protein n=1 Tax=Spongiactinospora sp. TRM90649 TaxID=3031114 RepID=UPI0023F7493C|nr:class I adenylate-forming enzyme family protein [Spongiactinospora sp. TRM90649]MDF5751970.1 class I adenylate-forming enzyme family protein [Spongiactinospora sp. TRM90649]
MALTHDRIQARLTAPGGLFEMDEIEVRGHPIRTWKHAPPHFRALLSGSRSHGGKPFLGYDGDWITFDDHYRRAAALALCLAGDYGVRKGDRVAIAMRNYPEWVIAFSAVLACGAVAVPLNAWWTRPELEYALTDCGATVLIADGERAVRMRDTPLTARLIVTRPLEEPPPGTALLADLVGEPGGEVGLPDVRVEPEDPATIFYTSGTTGRPKGALGSHRNLGEAPLTIAYSLTRAAALAGRDAAHAVRRRRVTLLAVPLFHVTGCFAAMIPSLFSGSAVVLMYKWDPGAALRLIETERVTGIAGVPTNAWQLMSHPGLGEHDVSSLGSLSYGGAPAPPRLVERIAEALPGRTPSNGYGMTETTSLVIHNCGADYAARPDSVGRPIPTVDVRITGPSGHDLPPGQVGELRVRGGPVITGYWNRPDATADTFTDGWLRTGDLARIDPDGYVYLVDRAKDVVIRGGENVYCAEVEAALFEHPAVDDAAVFGIPHDELGEEVGAVIRPLPGAGLEPGELTAFLRERIAPFKVPARFWFRDTELPRNAGGKLLKTGLRREVLGSS